MPLLASPVAGAAGDRPCGLAPLRFWEEAARLPAAAARCAADGCSARGGALSGVHVWVQGLPYGKVCAVVPKCGACAGAAGAAPCVLRNDQPLALTNACGGFDGARAAGTTCLGVRR